MTFYPFLSIFHAIFPACGVVDTFGDTVLLFGAPLLARRRRISPLGTSCSLRTSQRRFGHRSKSLRSSPVCRGCCMLAGSSVDSYLPDDISFSKVAGVGMNAEEMAANPRLTDRLVQNLNKEVSWSDGFHFSGAWTIFRAAAVALASVVPRLGACRAWFPRPRGRDLDACWTAAWDMTL